jgi:hypothetical protein
MWYTTSAMGDLNVDLINLKLFEKFFVLEFVNVLATDRVMTSHTRENIAFLSVSFLLFKRRALTHDCLLGISMLMNLI